MTTTTTTAAVAWQLGDELDRATAAPAGTLLGLDLAELLAERIQTRADLLAHQLCQDGDDRLAAQTVIDIMAALWPSCSPEDCGQAEWWRTPLGRMCARSLGHSDSDAVTYSVAAAMLGVARGTVSTLASRGTLDRHPDGGITRASVLLRLARLG